mmetsp:Transcript_9298/g.21238  ORF Transcript_9298/g.21238 Transcript_9298/m.21238 type:complete len:361 (+) Transcript_9298:157-1239(+)
MPIRTPALQAGAPHHPRQLCQAVGVIARSFQLSAIYVLGVDQHVHRLLDPHHRGPNAEHLGQRPPADRVPVHTQAVDPPLPAHGRRWREHHHLACPRQLVLDPPHVHGPQAVALDQPAAFRDRLHLRIDDGVPRRDGRDALKTQQDVHGAHRDVEQRVQSRKVLPLAKDAHVRIFEAPGIVQPLAEATVDVQVLAVGGVPAPHQLAPQQRGPEQARIEHRCPHLELACCLLHQPSEHVLPKRPLRESEQSHRVARRSDRSSSRAAGVQQTPCRALTCHSHRVPESTLLVDFACCFLGFALLATLSCERPHRAEEGQGQGDRAGEAERWRVRSRDGDRRLDELLDEEIILLLHRQFHLPDA